MTSDYLKFRGRCKELAEAAAQRDTTLRLVRGHYFCPIWNSEEPHWWCEKPDGTIVDPSCLQFPSAGLGVYTEFDGRIACAQCGKEITEAEAIFESNYAFCSSACFGRFVGVPVGYTAEELERDNPFNAWLRNT